MNLYEPKFKRGDCVIRNNKPDRKFIVNKIENATKYAYYYYLYDMYGEYRLAITPDQEDSYSKVDRQFIIDNAECFI
jgi:hypothetical protein